MNSEEPSEIQILFKKYDILIFYIIAVLITWTGWLVMDSLIKFIPADAELGQMISEGRFDIIIASLLLNILAIFSVFGPLLSAIVVYRVNYGKAGARNLLKKVFNLRVALPWYIIAIGVPIFIKYGAFYLNVWFLGGTFVSDLERASILLILTQFFENLIPSGGQEEVGWTGFAQLRLQQRLPVIPATLIKALMGWVWHLPLYLFFTWSGIFGADIWSFLMYYIPLAFIYTWLFNNTDSVLIPALFHATFNTIGAFSLANYTSWDTASITMIILCALSYLSVIIAFIRDGKNLTRKELPSLVPTPFQELEEFAESNRGSIEK
jgi:membrane protease YdiL (CAAX protease family)